MNLFIIASPKRRVTIECSGVSLVVKIQQVSGKAEGSGPARGDGTRRSGSVNLFSGVLFVKSCVFVPVCVGVLWLEMR